MLAFTAPPALIAAVVLGALFALVIFGDWLINLGFAWRERRARHLYTPNPIPPRWPSTEAIAWAATYQELQLLTQRVIAQEDQGLLDVFLAEVQELPFETLAVQEFIALWRGRLPARES